MMLTMAAAISAADIRHEMFRAHAGFTRHWRHTLDTRCEGVAARH